MDDKYTIFALGDSAATIELSKVIDESLNNKVLAMQKWFEQKQFTGLKDVIIGYSSLTVLFDPFQVCITYSNTGSVYDWIQKKLELAYQEASANCTVDKKINHIPVCYDKEFGVDLDYISRAKDLSVAAIIELHMSTMYRVYMLGFLPGFAYMGELPPRLIVPRKENPIPVSEGSVGIASNQTGIYPLSSPGGWQIIGRTPVKLFDAKTSYPTKLKAGDEVKFYEISREEFLAWKED